MKLKNRPSFLLLLLILLVGISAGWVVLRPVPLQSPQQMQASVPDYPGSFPPEETCSPLCWIGLTLAQMNAEVSGVSCNRCRSIRCRESGHVMHSLSVNAATCTELIYRAGPLGLPLIDKCYRNEFGGWVKMP